MRRALLPHLCCPSCSGDLALEETTCEGPHVVDGALTCPPCATAYPIRGGIPDFVTTTGAAAVEQTTSGFATNWHRYNEVILAKPALNDELFRDWIAPLSPENFEDKVVVDAGCGMGRWLTTAAPHAPRALIGFDYSDVVHTAYENSRHLKHVHIVRADIFRPPFRKRSVDVCYSIGVVHHTPDPEGAFASLLELVKDDGALSVWVYGQENNGWIEAAVTPLRERLTSKVPDPVLHGLSRVAALQLFAAAQVYARVFPQPTSFSYDAYTRHIAKYPRRYLEHIVYDHFVPQLAAYLPGDEVERWATARSLAHTLTARNANSWRLLVARNAEALARWSSPPRTEAVVDGAQPVNS